MRKFADVIKVSTNLTKIEATFRDENKESEAALNFLEEVNFYTQHKSGNIQKSN